MKHKSHKLNPCLDRCLQRLHAEMQGVPRSVSEALLFYVCSEPTRIAGPGLLESTHIPLCVQPTNFTQGVTLQEMPESAPVGQLPRSVDVRLEDDLVDTLKPGDRVRICGVYQAYTSKTAPAKGEDQSIRFQTVLVANNVIHLGKKLKEPTLTAKDRSACVRDK